MNVRSGYYGYHLGVECRFVHMSAGWTTGKSGGWKVYVENDSGVEEVYKYKIKDAKGEITSAYYVRTYCNYLKGRCYIDCISDDYVRLFPDLQTSNTLGMYSYHGKDIEFEMTYREFLEGVSEIWEEREKVSGLPFQVERIKHLMIMNHFLEKP